jgi:hypothetical protein
MGTTVIPIIAQYPAPANLRLGVCIPTQSSILFFGHAFAVDKWTIVQI